MGEKILARNAVKCLKCGDIIESEYTHDFKWCSCHNIFVDGGLSYMKIGGAALEDGSFENLSEWKNKETKW